MTALTQEPSMARMTDERHTNLRIPCGDYYGFSDNHSFRADFFPGTDPADGDTGQVSGRWGRLVVYGLTEGTYSLVYRDRVIARRDSNGVVAAFPLVGLTELISVDSLVLERI